MTTICACKDNLFVPEPYTVLFDDSLKFINYLIKIREFLTERIKTVEANLGNVSAENKPILLQMIKRDNINNEILGKLAYFFFVNQNIQENNLPIPLKIKSKNLLKELLTVFNDDLLALVRENAQMFLRFLIYAEKNNDNCEEQKYFLARIAVFNKLFRRFIRIIRQIMIRYARLLKELQDNNGYCIPTINNARKVFANILQEKFTADFVAFS